MFFLKVVSAIDSAMLNSKILIVSGATIWAIFQNFFTFLKFQQLVSVQLDSNFKHATC